MKRPDTIVLGITENSFDFSIVTRLVTFAKDLHHQRQIMHNNGAFISPNRPILLSQNSNLAPRLRRINQKKSN